MYVFGTYYLSMDNDLKSESYYRWGLLRIIWWPHQKLTKHRGMIHNPVIDPVILIGTFAILVHPILGFFPDRVLISALVGLILSTEAHYAADKIF